MSRVVAPCRREPRGSDGERQRGILWRALLEPLVTYAFVLVVLMCLACAVFGTALNHVVFERAVQ